MTADYTSSYIIALRVEFHFKTDEDEEGFVTIMVIDDGDKVIDFQEGFILESEFAQREHRDAWIREWLIDNGYQSGGNDV